MTEGPVALDDLVGTRETLIANAVGGMPDAHRRFLLSFEAGAPDWSLLDAPNAATLPAVQNNPTRRSRSRQASAGTGGAMSGWRNLTGIRVPNQSAMRWFTRFAGWVWEPGLFRIWPRHMVLSHAPAASVR